MRKRQTAVYAVGFVMLLYSLINALGSGQVLCESLGCRALQKPALWWAGAAYALMVLGASRFRPTFLGAIILVGMAVESALVLTQVLLNLYCPACLGYTALFLLFVILAGFLMGPLAKKNGMGHGRSHPVRRRDLRPAQSSGVRLQRVALFPSKR